MMTKLTEDMIIARTKSSDLGAVKKLNCWGSDLDDISLVKRLHNVEVLSLSLNKITTLCDFQYCRNLVELYIRRNAIRDLSELVYLQELPRLRRLLLAENPCVETAGPAYRATVIRCLPNLEVLDNSEVSTDEIEHARVNGLILEHPLVRRERNSPDEFIRDAREEENIQAMNRRNSSNAAQVEYDESVFRSSTALSRSPPPEYSPYSVQDVSQEAVPISNGIRRSPSSSPEHVHLQQHLGRRNSTIVGGSETIGSPAISPQLELSPSSSHSPTNNNNCTSTAPPYAVGNLDHTATTNHVPRRVQRSPVEPYYPVQQTPEISNGGVSSRISDPPSAYYGQDNSSTGRRRSRSGSVDYVNQYQQQTAYQQQQQQRERESTYGGDRDYHHHHHYPAEESSPPPPTATVHSRTSSSNLSSRGVVNGSVRGSRDSTTKPPRTKSSNLLSAVLCLIPELDWASLEVVELAVRRRMDELLSD